MTDLEIVKACADAIGIMTVFTNFHPGDDPFYMMRDEDGIYDPLHDDAQAMALVKRFKLFINHSDADEGNYWKTAPHGQGVTHCNADLNRAICECVAALRPSKPER